MRKWLKLLIFAITVLSIVCTSTLQGILRLYEFQIYDTFLCYRIFETASPRITIVSITDKDLDLYGAVIPDNILSLVIKNINNHDPRIIGLDLHRNQPTGKGYEQLNQIFRSVSGIVGVEKTSQGSFDFPAIKPNQELAKKGMIGASDLIEDQDGVVRRGYLYVTKGADSDEQIPSFGLKVALEYLKQENIESTSSGNKNHYLKLKNIVFPRLRENHFFYKLEDIDDYQNIINYRSANFTKLTLNQILNNDFDSSQIKNKIILIGISAPSLADDIRTPLSVNITDSSQEAFAVDIHAHQASQIISAVKDKRKIIKLSFSTIEYIWLLFWIIIFSYYSIYQISFNVNRYYTSFKYFLVNSLFLLLVILAGYISLVLFGYWLPTATVIFAWAVSLLFGFFHLEITREQQISKRLGRELNSKISELGEVQDRLVDYKKVKAYGNFSVKMAHELGNILNSIQLANDNSSNKFENLKAFLLENSFLFEDLDEADSDNPLNNIDYIESKYNKIEKDISKASLITSTVRAEYTDAPESSSLINLNRFIQKIVEEGYWRRDSTILPTIEFNLSSTIKNIKIYPMGLELVLVNLLANANYTLNQKSLKLSSEYTPTITISTFDYLYTVEIIIKDNGEGISQENINKIFNPFWSTKKDANGIGVGLFFCQQKIQEHKGEIRVESIYRNWTQFVLTLPKTNLVTN